jgi:hypothetical protein
MKKKVWFLTMGPPSEPPHWLLRSSVVGDPGGVNQSARGQGLIPVEVVRRSVEVVGSRLDHHIQHAARVAASSALLLLCSENSAMASIGSTTPAMPETPP